MPVGTTTLGFGPGLELEGLWPSFGVVQTLFGGVLPLSWLW